MEVASAELCDSFWGLVLGIGVSALVATIKHEAQIFKDGLLTMAVKFRAIRNYLNLKDLSYFPNLYPQTTCSRLSIVHEKPIITYIYKWRIFIEITIKLSKVCNKNLE